MGRRVTSTTKGGKFMNPTDQARKEARRRELKKNKKQRLAVRQAVIKTKDPYQMIRELEELDDMELDPTSETHYNEKVIRDKRRKLLETLIRILDFYFKEDSVRGHDLKTILDNYKLDRAKKEMYYESVKNAQTVEITNIPLPDAPFETPHLSDIPLPGIKPASILKKVPPGPPVGLPPVLRTEKKPPGPPPGEPPAKKVFGRGMKAQDDDDMPPPDSPPSPPLSPGDNEMMDDAPYDPEEELDLIDEVHLPPDLDDDDDDEEFHHRDDDDDDLHDENESDDDHDANQKRSVRFADDDDDDEGKNKEDASKEELPPGMTPLQAMMLKLAGQSIPTARSSEDRPVQEEDYDDEEGPMDDDVPKVTRPKPPGPPPGLPPGPPPGMPPAMMGRPGMMPPGPPPGRPPTMPMNMGPRMMGPPDGPDRGMRMMPNPNVLSAPPSLIHRPSNKDIDDTQSATITAKPKLTTNPKVDSTRFMPTSLRVRREVKGRPGASGGSTSSSTVSEKQTHERKKKQHTTTADAAYDSFMKEMQGLL